MRVWSIAAACLALASLGGCGVPAAVSIASYAADGFSFLSTGRSVTDHGISILFQKDCALLRAVRGRPICKRMQKNDPVYDIAFAERTYAYVDPDNPSPNRSAPPIAQWSPPPVLMAKAEPLQPVVAVTEPPPAPAPMPEPAARTAAAPAQPIVQASIVLPPRRPAIARPEPSLEPPQSVITPGYHVVAGAFRNREAAQARRA